MTKCPTDAVQKSLTLHLMATCANTLQSGVNCYQCFSVMVFYELNDLLGQAMLFYSQANTVSNTKKHTNTKVIWLNLKNFG